MKKKLSIAMAGMMSVASVVPVFAANEAYPVENYGNTSEELEALRDELAEYYGAEYATGDPKVGKNVYEITYVEKIRRHGKSEVIEAKTIENLNEFYNEIKNSSNEFEITIKDNGHIKDENGNYYSQTDATYVSHKSKDKEDVVLSNVEIKGNPFFEGYEVEETETYTDEDGIEYIWGHHPHISKTYGAWYAEYIQRSSAVEKASYDSVKNTVSVKTVNPNAEILTLNVGDVVYDFSSPIDASGNKVQLDRLNTGLYEQNCKRVVGFKTVKKDIDAEITKQIKVNGEHRITLDRLYDGLSLTTEGSKVLSAYNKTNHKSVELHIPNGVTPYLEVSIGHVDFVIESNSTKNLNEFMSILKSGIDNVTTIAGEDRYETAVKIAEENYKNPKHFVIVNGTAIVDGLAAAPFAASEDAPILLTESGKLSSATKKYIAEQIGLGAPSDYTVTIIGGDAVVSDEVIKELKKDLHIVNVNRIGGEDRQETSLKVAQAIDTTEHDVRQVYVVGANGEADAMSVASIAAEEKSPIIVAGFDGIAPETLKFIKD